MADETDTRTDNVVEHPKQHRLQLAANNESKQRTDLAVATQDPAGWTIGDMLQYALEQHNAGEPIKATGGLVILVDPARTKVAYYRSGLSDFELFGVLGRMPFIV
jgi:hypothetical protein